MNERRAMAIGAAISAACTTAGGGLIAAATTQGMAWALAAGTVLGILGGAMGAALTAYKLTGGAEPEGEPVIGGESAGHQPGT